MTRIGAGSQQQLPVGVLIPRIQPHHVAPTVDLGGMPTQHQGHIVRCVPFGVVRDATGGWAASFGMLGVCLVVLSIGAVMINGPRHIEDDAEASRVPART